MDLKTRAEEMRSFFDRKIDTYDEVHAAFAETKKLLTDGLPDGTKTVLDLGAGTGLELIPLFERFPDIRVTAVDVSPKMLAVLAERPFADRVRIVCGDFFTADFGGPFDAVVSTSALHHFPPREKEELYRRIRGCLRPGGVFLNSDKISPDRRAEAEALAEYEADPARWPHMDTPLAPSTETELLENAGFRQVFITPTDRDNYRLFTAVREE